MDHQYTTGFQSDEIVLEVFSLPIVILVVIVFTVYVVVKALEFGSFCVEKPDAGALAFEYMGCGTRH